MSEIKHPKTVQEFLKDENIWEWISARGGMQMGTQELIDLLEKYAAIREKAAWERACKAQRIECFRAIPLDKDIQEIEDAVYNAPLSEFETLK